MVTVPSTILEIEETPVISAGIEYYAIKSLAIRCGYYNGLMTAGAGLRLGSYELNYAIEMPSSDHADMMQPIHKFGFSIDYDKAVKEDVPEWMKVDPNQRKERNKKGESVDDVYIYDF